MKTLTALFLLALATLAQAGQLVDVQIVDRSTGQVLPSWQHRGKLYVAGTPGNRYAVRLLNKSGGRVLSVISVDGINAVTGEPASPEQSGYVLSPGQGTDIAGWRKSMEEVAAFYFTSLGDSYAARSGRPQNTGVIGVAIFREQESAPPLAYAPAAQSPAKAEASASAEQRSRLADNAAPLGTGHGERLTARTRNTEFERASPQANEIIRIYYDSRSNLIARGIIPVPQPYRPVPDAFPGGFVPDPRS